MGRDGDVGVEAESGNSGTAGSGQGGGVLSIDLVADFQPTASTGSAGYPTRNRSAVEFGQQRLIVQERIGL